MKIRFASLKQLKAINLFSEFSHKNLMFLKGVEPVRSHIDYVICNIPVCVHRVCHIRMIMV